MIKEQTIIMCLDIEEGTFTGTRRSMNKMQGQCQGRIQGGGGGEGGAHPARAPPKIGKNMICWRKIVIFHTKYLNYFKYAPPNLKSWIRP